MVMVVLPAVLLPGIGADARQIVVLFALIAAVLTFVEYSAAYPSLVEFRYAPPFNRIRFLALFATLMMLTVIVRGQFVPTTFSLLAEAVGHVIGQAMDFPYSPVRLVTLMLPADTPLAQIATVRALAGMSYIVSLLMLTVFIVAMRLGAWPSRNGSFNVWVNLPTFDPTAGGDVVERLERDARFNIALGFLLPFLIPAGVRLVTETISPAAFNGGQTLVWIIAAWAFLPASLFMRGIAMWRVARMIRAQRAANTAEAEGGLHAV
jgi:uncharacterized membrane protein YciS (DUF1049 family)